jgi:hypothetical protein
MAALATRLLMVELTTAAVVSTGVWPLKGSVDVEPVAVVVVVAGPVAAGLVLLPVVPAVVTSPVRAVVMAAVLTGAEPAGVTTASCRVQHKAGML